MPSTGWTTRDPANPATPSHAAERVVAPSCRVAVRAGEEDALVAPAAAVANADDGPGAVDLVVSGDAPHAPVPSAALQPAPIDAPALAPAAMFIE